MADVDRSLRAATGQGELAHGSGQSLGGGPVGEERFQGHGLGGDVTGEAAYGVQAFGAACDEDQAGHTEVGGELDDGRLELDTNTVERAIRPTTLCRKNALFAGSDSGGRHWAIVMTLIQTAKLNDVEPLAWLTDVLERMVSRRTKSHELNTLLPWHWKAARDAAAASA